MLPKKISGSFADKIEAKAEEEAKQPKKEVKTKKVVKTKVAKSNKTNLKGKKRK